MNDQTIKGILTEYSGQNYKYEVKEQTHYVKIEELMVSVTNTIVNPLAMMIKSFNTTVANVAMPRLRSTNDLTSRTQQVRV